MRGPTICAQNARGLSRLIMDSPANASNPQHYTLLSTEPERRRTSSDGDSELYDPTLDGEPVHDTQGVHYATEAEKKRLWWRNAVINAIFIASW